MNEIAQRNYWKTYLYMAILTAVIGIAGTLISMRFNFGLTGTGIFLILAGIIDFIAYFFSDRILLRSAGAKFVSQEQAPELYQIVKELCDKENLPLPKICLMPVDEMNAFATGRNKNHSAIAVTKGLLEKLTPEEVKAVIAHELSHIGNYDIMLMAFIAVGVGFISILSDVYWHTAARTKNSDKSGAVAIIGMLLSLFAPIVAMVVKFAISRKRELLADAGAARIIGRGRDLISALKKISLDRRPLPNVGPATAHLYFSNPFRPDGFFDKLFSTHPSLEERIKNLEGINNSL